MLLLPPVFLRQFYSRLIVFRFFFWFLFSVPLHSPLSLAVLLKHCHSCSPRRPAHDYPLSTLVALLPIAGERIFKDVPSPRNKVTRKPPIFSSFNHNTT